MEAEVWRWASRYRCREACWSMIAAMEASIRRMAVIGSVMARRGARSIPTRVTTAPASSKEPALPRGAARS
jgi:hypothetical protein